MKNITTKNDPNNRGRDTLNEQLRSIWLPLHHSISNLTLQYQVDGNYLRDLAKRLGLRRTLLVPA